MIFTSMNLFARFNVHFKVISSEGEPMSGVTVMEQGKTNGVTSDFEGNVNIVVESSTSMLVVSFLGSPDLLTRANQCNNKVFMIDPDGTIHEVAEEDNTRNSNPKR